MLHLIWYIIVGFLAGWVAKALLHVHLPIVWTIVLGIMVNPWRRGNSLILAAKRGRSLSPGGINRFHTGSHCGSIRVAQVQTAHSSRLKIHRRRGPSAHGQRDQLRSKLT
jgi:hypothetical protein